MPKPLVVSLAAALIALPGPASAVMDLYGAAHVSLDVVNNNDPDPANEDTLVSVTSNNSYVGLRGREKVRERLAVSWQFETIVDLDDGGWGEGRDSFVGLETPIGELLAGRHATPYRQLSERLDIFADTRADHSAVIGTIDGDNGGEPVFYRRASNIFQYTSPERYRLRFGAAYIANQSDDNLPQTNDEADLDGYSASLRFVGGPLEAGFAYEVLGRTRTPTQDDAIARKAAVGWDFGQGTRTAVIWEQAGDGAIIGGSKRKRDAWYFNLSHVSGNFTWKFAYGMLDELGNAPDSGATHLAAGFSWVLAPGTELYLIAAGVNNENNAQYGLQPYHDEVSDSSGAIPASAPGENVSALSGGLIHRFDLGL